MLVKFCKKSTFLQKTVFKFSFVDDVVTENNIVIHTLTKSTD